MTIVIIQVIIKGEYMKSYSDTLSFEVDSGDTYEFTLFLLDKEIEEIKALQAKVKELDVYEITRFDAPLEVTSDTEDPPMIDFAILHVQENFIRVTGVLKHDRHTFSTGIISLDQFEETI